MRLVSFFFFLFISLSLCQETNEAPQPEETTQQTQQSVPDLIERVTSERLREIIDSYKNVFVLVTSSDIGECAECPKAIEELLALTPDVMANWNALFVVADVTQDAALKSLVSSTQVLPRLLYFREKRAKEYYGVRVAQVVAKYLTEVEGTACPSLLSSETKRKTFLSSSAVRLVGYFPNPSIERRQFEDLSSLYCPEVHVALVTDSVLASKLQLKKANSVALYRGDTSPVFLKEKWSSDAFLNFVRPLSLPPWIDITDFNIYLAFQQKATVLFLYDNGPGSKDLMNIWRTLVLNFKKKDDVNFLSLNYDLYSQFLRAFKIEETTVPSFYLMNYAHGVTAPTASFLRRADMTAAKLKKWLETELFLILSTRRHFE